MLKKILYGFLALIILLIAGMAIVFMSIDPNAYREKIVEVLAKQTGRTVKLSGPIHLGLSWSGITISIQDAALGNPAWASRPEMAGIGKFELDVEPLPLLNHKLVISSLTIANADILLESSPSGQNNWELAFASTTAVPAKTQPAVTGSSSTQAVAVNVDHLSITGSQLAMRDKTGKITLFKVKDLTVTTKASEMDVVFEGEFNAADIALKVKMGTSDIMANAVWPINLDLTYANYHVQANGTMNLAAKVANIDSYKITASKSELDGKVAANWAGARPNVKGTLNSAHFVPADFKPTAAEAGPSSVGTDQPVTAQRYMFSDAPLGLDALKIADANIEMTLNDVALPSASIKQINGIMALQAGRLDMPIKVAFGKSALSGSVSINAATSPAQLMFKIASPNIDLADLLALGGSPAFLTGSADVDANIGASGNSLHALASSMNGTINIIAAGGSVSSSAAKDVSSSLMEIFAPNGSSALNCVAARFIASNGLVKDNGILIDTAATTIAGKGGADMRNETIGMTLRAETKVANLGGLLPPLTVGGTFLKPTYSMDPTAVVQNVIGALTGAGLGSSGVPKIVAQAGQNACLYTLDHPSAASTQSSVLLPGLQGQTQKLKDVGGQVLKGLFGQ